MLKNSARRGDVGILRGVLVALATLALSRPAFAADPLITSVSPSSVFQNSSTLNIGLAGTSFTDGGAPTVRFTPPGGIATSLTINGSPTATAISAVLPSSLLTTSGTGALEVQSGVATSTPFPYTIVPEPVVTGIIPTTVVAGGVGFTLTVNGSGFIAPTFGPSPAPGTVVRFPVASNPVTPLGEGLPTTFVSSTQLTALVPGSDTTLTRSDLARLTVLAQLSEQGITAFLNATGGVFCSFADVPCPAPGPVTDTTGVATGWRYTESMYRLGYTKGCGDTSGGVRHFCPGVSANLLGSPGTSGIRAVNLILSPLSERNSGPVDLAIVAPTPTPTNTPTNTPTSTQTPDPRVAAIPMLAPEMLGLLAAGLAALALLLLRRP